MKSYITILVFCLCFLQTIVTAQSVLQYNLEVGEVFTMSQSAKQNIIQQMDGARHEMKNIIDANYVFKVIEVNDSLYTLGFRFESFKMLSTSNLMGELISVNTKDSIAEDDIQGKIFSGLTKSNLTMTMYKTGKIKELSGTEELIIKMIEEAGEFDEFTQALMKESMKGEFGDESLIESFEQMTFIYSEKPVSEGDSWENNFIGDLSAKNKWTLVKAKKDINTIEGVSDIVLNTEEEAIIMKLEGTMDSKIIANSKTGFINEMTTTSTAKGISILKQMNNTEVPTTVISDVTYKITKNVQ